MLAVFLAKPRSTLYNIDILKVNENDILSD